MTDKRNKALEWIERQIRQARQALGRSEYKPGVKPEELENLRAKIALLEFISGAVLKVDDTEPTLDYAPVKHGEWKYNFAFAGMVLRTAVIKCSECDHIAHRIEGEKFVYCPNCGAWMDGKEDGKGD